MAEDKLVGMGVLSNTGTNKDIKSNNSVPYKVKSNAKIRLQRPEYEDSIELDLETFNAKKDILLEKYPDLQISRVDKVGENDNKYTDIDRATIKKGVDIQLFPLEKPRFEGFQDSIGEVLNMPNKKQEGVTEEDILRYKHIEDKIKRLEQEQEKQKYLAQEPTINPLVAGNVYGSELAINNKHKFNENKRILDDLYKQRLSSPFYKQEMGALNDMLTNMDKLYGNARKELLKDKEKLFMYLDDVYQGQGYGAKSLHNADVVPTKQDEIDYRDNKLLLSAQNLLTEAKQLLSAPNRHDNSSGVANYFKGAYENLDKVVPLYGLIQSANMAKDLLPIISKIEEHEGKEYNLLNMDLSKTDYLSKGEKAYIQALLTKGMIEAKRQGDLSLGYQAGSSSAQSLGFMADFMLTGGVGDIVSAPIVAGGKGLAKKAIEKGIYNGLTKQALKAGTSTLANMAKAGIMTPLMPSTYAGVADDMLKIQDNGRVDLSLSHLGNSIADKYIETLSETMGGQIEVALGLPKKALSKGASAIIGKTNYQAIANALSSPTIKEILQKGGYYGLLGEYGEEWLGAGLRTLTGVDENAIKDFATTEQQIITLASIGPFALLGMGSSAVQNKVVNYQANKYKTLFEQALKDNGYTDEKIKTITDVTNATNPTELANGLAPVLQQIEEDNPHNYKDIVRKAKQYAFAVSRKIALDYTQATEIQAKKEQIKQDLLEEIGSQYYMASVGKDDNTTDILRSYVMQDGTSRYITAINTNNDGNNTYAYVDNNGGKGYMTEEDLQTMKSNNLIVDEYNGTLDDYLQKQLVAIDKTTKQQELLDSVNQQKEELLYNLQEGQIYNTGPVENPYSYTILQIAPDGVIVQGLNGEVENKTIEEFASLIGEPIKTEDNQEEEQANEIIEQEDKSLNGQEDVEEYMPKEDNEVEEVQDTQDKEQTVLEEATNEQLAEPNIDEVAKDYKGRPLPMREHKDGRLEVDESALWNTDPMAWMIWNGKERNDKGANSIAYVEAVLKSLNIDKSKLEKLYTKSIDLDKRKEIEDKISLINNRVNELKTYAELLPAEFVENFNNLNTTNTQNEQEDTTAQHSAKESIGDEHLDKWDNSKKIVGKEYIHILPNGQRVSGNYVLVEALAPLASHNPNQGFAKTEGFPVDENGKTLNDRDYEIDKNAQLIVRMVAFKYDGRALQNPVIVSKEGIVLSGNQRTMASQLSAVEGTDTLYLEDLQRTIEQYGFNTEQLKDFNHPRVVVVLKDDLPYTTKTFSQFNAQETKSQSPTEKAIKIGKTLEGKYKEQIAYIIDEYNKTSGFLNSSNGIFEVLKVLVNAGIINSNDYSQYIDPATGKVTASGVEFVKSVILGSVITKEALVAVNEVESVRRLLLNAGKELLMNSLMSEKYNLCGEISEAVEVVCKARTIDKVKPDEGLYYEFNKGQLFVKPKYYNELVQYLAHIINKSKYTSLQSFLQSYNADAFDAEKGQMNIIDQDKGSRTKKSIASGLINRMGEVRIVEVEEFEDWNNVEGRYVDNVDTKEKPVPNTLDKVNEEIPYTQKSKSSSAGKVNGLLNKKSERWIEKCIYNDPAGYAVSTNTKILIADKLEYDEKNKDKVINYFDKSVIDKRYPEWQELFDDKNFNNSFKLDCAYIAGQIRTIRKQEKEKQKKDKKNKTNTYIEFHLPNHTNFILTLENAEHFFSACERMGIEEVAEYRLKVGYNTLKARNENGYVMVLGSEKETSYFNPPTYYYIDCSNTPVNDKNKVSDEVVRARKLASREEEIPTLVGVHNISENKLRKAINMGGLTNPSIAVIDSDSNIHSKFGEISLILPSSKIDKRSGKNIGTYYSDAYTPTYPIIQKHISNKGAKLYAQAHSKIFPSNDVDYNIGNIFPPYNNDYLDVLRDESLYNKFLSYWFLKLNNLNPFLQYYSNNTLDARATINKAYDRVKKEYDKEFQSFIEDFEKTFDITEVVFDGYTQTGNRRYVPTTLTNISKIMKKEGRNSVDSFVANSFNGYVASVIGKGNTLKDIRSNKSKLTGNLKDIEALKTELEPIFNDVVGEVSREKNIDRLSAISIMRKVGNKNDINTFLKDNYGFILSEDVIKNWEKLRNNIINDYKTNYFETKFERPVLFNEFVSAVVPLSISDDIKQYLQNSGVEVFEYGDNNLSREDAFRNAIQAEQIRFRKEATGQIGELEQINNIFNEKLDNQIEGTLPKGYIYYLGLPGDILLSTGIPNLPIELSSAHLTKKASQNNHQFDIDLVRDLPLLLQEPIAVFEYGSKDKAQNVIVEVEYKGKQLLVGLHINQQRQGIEVNDIRGLFPKDTQDWLNWISQGKSLYLNKEKIQAKIIQHRINADEVNYLNLDFITKVVEDFENPKFLRSNLENINNTFTNSMERKHIVATEVAKKIGVEVEIISKDKLPKDFDTALGLYKGGKIYICLENCPSEEQVQKTILHEAVGHKGLRKLLGDDNMREAMQHIMNNVSEEVKRKIVDHARKHNYNFNEAVEEYLAYCVETMEFDSKAKQMWDTIAKIIQNVLRKIGVNIALNDRDIRWLMWQSYNVVKTDIITQAKRQQIGNNLGFSLLSQDIVNTANEQIRLNKTFETAQQAYNWNVASFVSRIKEAFVDQYEAVNKLVEAIEQFSNKPIRPFEDVRLLLNQAHSRALSEANKWQRDFFNPFLQEMKEVIKSSGLSFEDVERYMMIKHILERNEVLAQRDALEDLEKDYLKNQKLIIGSTSLKEDKKKRLLQKIKIEYVNDKSDINSKQGKKYLDYWYKDYGGLKSYFKENEDTNSQIPLDIITELAQKEISNIEDRANFEKMWQLWKASTNNILDNQVKAGNLNNATRDKLSKMFSNYVPLRGFEEETAEDLYTYFISRNNGSINSPIKTAKGRHSKATSPIANIVSMAFIGAKENAHNNAVLSLYYLSQNRAHNNLLATDNVWYVIDYKNINLSDNNLVYKIAEFVPDLNNADIDVNTQYKQWQKHMIDMYMQGLAYRKEDVENKSIDYVVHIDKQHKSEHAIRFKVNGEEKVMYVLGNPRAAQAINGIIAKGENGKITEALNTILRVEAQLNTGWNPEFWINNFMRDIVYGTISQGIKHKAGGQFLKNMAIGASAIAYNYKYDKSNWSANNKYKKEYELFVENGGTTGYIAIDRVEKYNKIVRKAIKDKKIKIGAFKTIANAIVKFGEGIEQQTRFAAFLTARDRGKSVIEAINEAKEVTVNFNRKGSRTLDIKGVRSIFGNKELTGIEKVLGYSLLTLNTYGSNFIFFWNASIQGAYNFYNLAKKNPKSMSVCALVYFALGYANAFTQAILFSGGDDGEDQYLNIPDAVKRNNIVLGTNGVYLRWGLPQELRVFYGLGDVFAQHQLGRYPNRNIAKETTNFILGAYSPFDFDNGVVGFAPSVLRPIIEAGTPFDIGDFSGTNKDYRGVKIRNENPYMKESIKEVVPKYTEAPNGVMPLFVDVAKVINNISGGDNVKAGAINLDPAGIEHYINSLGGGLMNTVSKIGKTINTLVDKDEETQIRNIPFISRIMLFPNEQFIGSYVNEMYNYYTKLSDQNEYKRSGYIKDLNTDKAVNEYADKDFLIYSYHKVYANIINNISKIANNTDDIEDKKKYFDVANYYKKEFIKRCKEIETKEQ